MPKALINALKILASIVLAIVILYFVFKNIEWSEFWSQAKEVDYQWIIYSILLSILAYILRAYRWNILLEPMGYTLKTRRTLLAVLIGYLANLAIPRLGEITRCGILNRNDQVPVNLALGSVVTERIIDMLTLLSLLIAGLLIERDLLSTFLSQSYADLNIPALYIWIGLGLLILCGILVYFLLIRRKWDNKISTLIAGFLEGILSLRKMKRPIGFFVSTFLLWVIYYLMSFIIVYTLPATSGLELSAGLMLLITGGIALALPVQSGFGTYHGMIAGMLALYGIEKTTGLFLATLLHTSQIVAVAIFGGIALLISFFIKKNTLNEPHPTKN